MDINAITTLLTNTANSGSKKPCIFDRLRLQDIKSKLEACKTIQQVMLLLVSNKPFLMKTYGLTTQQCDRILVNLKKISDTV